MRLSTRLAFSLCDSPGTATVAAAAPAWAGREMGIQTYRLCAAFACLCLVALIYSVPVQAQTRAQTGYVCVRNS